MQYLVVAGGGGGGTHNCGYGGGAGAGGLLQGNVNITCTGALAITIGAGGTSTWPSATAGSNTTVSGSILSSTILTYGGGKGGSPFRNEHGSVLNGGSGGSGSGSDNTNGPPGKGVYPGSTFVSGPRQGYDGAMKYCNGAGGGGGAGGVGGTGGYPACYYYCGFGGLGICSSISGTPTIYAHGGSTYGCTQPCRYFGSTGAPNTGNGGGGNANLCYHAGGYRGGSGVVIVKYQFQ